MMFNVTPERLTKLCVYVYVEDVPIAAGQLEVIGTAWPPAARTSRFRYSESWINRPDAFAIDPLNLPLTAAWQETSPGMQVHGVFRDASPTAGAKPFSDCSFLMPPSGASNTWRPDEMTAAASWHSAPILVDLVQWIPSEDRSR